jgi:hypothetical protein
MGIWLHTHIITTTDASPDFGKLAEILPDESVQTMLEVITKSEVGQSAVWLLNTSLEDL